MGQPKVCRPPSLSEASSSSSSSPSPAPLINEPAMRRPSTVFESLTGCTQQRETTPPLLDDAPTPALDDIPTASLDDIPTPPLSPTATTTASASIPASASPTACSSTSFLCPYTDCGKFFKRRAKLEEHLNVHTGARPFVCTEQGCTASYRTRARLQAHARSAHLAESEQERAKAFVCEEDGCGRRFWTRQHLDRHLQGVHGGENSATDDADAKPYPCTEAGCTAAFTKRKRLREHIWQTHADATAADTAGGDGGGPSSTLLPFACSHPGCTKRFPTNSKRRAHSKTHAQDRYICALPHAGGTGGDTTASTGATTTPPAVLTFPTWSALQAHMREAHPPTCPYASCNGKVFKNRDNLKMHIRRHEEREREQQREHKGVERGRHDDEERWHEASDGEEGGEGDEAGGAPRHPRIFKCDWVGGANIDADSDAHAACTKTFKSTHALQTHVRVAHLRLRPFVCACGKAYGHKHLLGRHQVKCGIGGANTREGGDGGDAGAEGARARTHSSDGDGERDGDESTLDSEEEDDVFRQGGGALPERLRGADALVGGRSTNGKRRRSLLDDASSGARTTRPRTSASASASTSLVDLLTGRGYASTSTSTQTQTRTIRRTRGRFIACPIPRLARAPTGSPPAACASAATRAPPTASPSSSPSPPCAFRFSRLYDVRRHLASAHGLALEDDAAVRAMLEPSEVAGLARPRGQARGQARGGKGSEGL